jgi:hypothetical protein
MAEGKLLIAVGAIILILGVVILYCPSLISWFGRLPGDVRYQSESVSVYFPWVSLLLLSALFSLMRYLFR